MYGPGFPGIKSWLFFYTYIYIYTLIYIYIHVYIYIYIFICSKTVFSMEY